MANFHDERFRFAYVLSPATSSIGTASHISFKSSSVSFSPTEPMLASKFFVLVVPAERQEQNEQTLLRSFVWNNNLKQITKRTNQE